MPALVRPLLFLFLLAPLSVAWAHTASLTRVEIEQKNHGLVATLQLHQADLIEHVVDPSEPRARFADAVELADASAAILEYVKSQVALRVDGALVEWDSVGWPPERFDVVGAGSRAGDVPPTVPMTLRAKLPDRATRAEVSFHLFSRAGFSPMYDVSIAVEGRPPISRVVEPGQAVLIEVSTGSDNSPDASTSHPGFWGEIAAFGRLGFHHILPAGLDHVLFVLGLYFFSANWRVLLGQVTAFTVAHSVTLALAALGLVHLPGAVVEPLIALSIAAVAIENILRRGRGGGNWRWGVVFGFGLIHGLGFAEVLAQAHAQSGHTGAMLVGFNIGVELGQLTVIAIAAALTGWWRHRPWFFSRVAAPASAVIACIGLYWAAERVLG